MMRDIGEGTIRRIDWQELTPVVLLLRVFNLSTGIRVLLLALLGVLTTLAIGAWFNTTVSPVETQPLCDLEPLLSVRSMAPAEFLEEPGRFTVESARRSVLAPWLFFTKTGASAYQPSPQTWTDRGLSILWPVSVLLIWSFFGGLICRTVALQVAIDEKESPGGLFRFLKQRGIGYLSSVLLIVLGILFCLGVIWIGGFLFRHVPLLDYVFAILYPVALLLGFFAVVMLLGLWFGWPLLVAAVSVEGTDGFDAVSRMFSYVYQRPFHYFFYWLVSGIWGLLGFVLLSIFLNGIVLVTATAGGFHVEAGVPTARVIQSDGVAATAPMVLVSTWSGLVGMLLSAYVFSWFWASSTAIYMLLRRSVDATPLVEVYRTGPAAVPPRPLPEIKLDEKGAPGINPNADP